MPLERTSLDDVSEKDLLDLIGASVPEGLALEYKSKTYGGTDAQKKEALKDISSFANSDGGHLVIGMDEKPGGIPDNLTGLSGVNVGDEINRLESLARDGIEPRVAGLRMRAIPVANGSAIVIRVPKSWNPPHRVASGGSNRFYVRNSGGVHEASVEELRTLFTLTATAREKIAEFRTARIAKVVGGRGPVVLSTRRLLFLHLLPLAAFGQPRSLDLERVFKEGRRFMPIGTTAGRTDRFNLDGFINVRGGEVCHGYTQVFRSGIVEATKALREDPDDHTGVLYWGDVVKTVEAIPEYLDGLRVLDIPPPVVAMISVHGMAGAQLGLYGYDRRSQMDRIAPLPADDPLLLPEVVLEDFGTPPETLRGLAPALDALWNAAGFAKCTYYDENGNWRPPARP